MIKNMKKGYTLIELIIVIFVMCIIISIGSISISVVKNTLNTLKVNYAINDITNFLSYSKYYCKNNNVNGVIFIRKEDTMELICVSNGKTSSEKLSLPKGLHFTTNYQINCNSNGVLSSDTIYFYDNDNKAYKITISVGIDIINCYYE